MYQNERFDTSSDYGYDCKILSCQRLFQSVFNGFVGNHLFFENVSTGFG